MKLKKKKRKRTAHFKHSQSRTRRARARAQSMWDNTVPPLFFSFVTLIILTTRIHTHGLHGRTGLHHYYRPPSSSLHSQPPVTVTLARFTSHVLRPFTPPSFLLSTRPPPEPGSLTTTASTTRTRPTPQLLFQHGCLSHDALGCHHRPGPVSLYSVFIEPARHFSMEGYSALLLSLSAFVSTDTSSRGDIPDRIKHSR